MAGVTKKSLPIEWGKGKALTQLSFIDGVSILNNSLSLSLSLFSEKYAFISSDRPDLSL